MLKACSAQNCVPGSSHIMHQLQLSFVTKRYPAILHEAAKGELSSIVFPSNSLMNLTKALLIFAVGFVLQCMGMP